MANERAAVGALLLGVGGAILFALLDIIVSNFYENNNGNNIPPFPIVIIGSFIGFAILGFGLALIVQSGKT